jgi:excisionase family DNA binding protein
VQPAAEAAERVAAVVAAPAEPAPWVGVADAAQHMDAPASRVYALVSAGRIPHERDGSRLLFRRSDLDKWMRNGGARRP